MQIISILRTCPRQYLGSDDHPLLTLQNIQGNKRPWNGVDYSEFTDHQKAKIRAHYAGLVKQIDHIIGEILKALKDQGKLDKTVIIFSLTMGLFG